MSKDIILNGPTHNFEELKRIDDNGIEFWLGRELMLSLGYKEWRNFEEVIAKAARACMESGQNVDNHFVEFNKMVPIGSNTVRSVKDYKLDRYACYLIAQNGDPGKPEIALAQTYFAIQTRNQELFQQLTDKEKRVYIRGEVATHNKKLFSTAKSAGVSTKGFGLFNDAGYRGLYGMPLTEVEKRKGIKKGELLDRAGSTELAANLFRITQTDEKLKKDGVKGADKVIGVHNMVGGKVRQTIKDIGGVLPENLPPELHIKEIRKEIKKLKKPKPKKIK